MKLGLLGKNISYSFSQKYFTDKFKLLGMDNSSYSVFDIQGKEEIYNLFNEAGLLGFNVTIPYKQEIINFLDELSPEAEKIGAVNTVKIYNGKRKGFNTDALGFKNSLIPLLKPQHSSALILGSGGASKAIAYVLKELNIDYKIVSRNGEFTYSSLNHDIIKSHLLIINTTPVGTFPAIEDMPPINLDAISEKHLIYDLIYNPEETKLLRLAKEKNAQIKNGLEMLHLQAEAAWEIWKSNI